MRRRDAAVLVMAKSPIAGRVKTRLGEQVGMQVAADLANAALLDTLDACEAAFPPGCRYLALAGEPTLELADRLDGWNVFPQRGNGFGERLHDAHTQVVERAGLPVVQIGMDTPQITTADLTAVTQALVDNDAVLGPAEDGGWWVLAVHEPRHTSRLAQVSMSTPRTCLDTRRELTNAGASVGDVHSLRDVDTSADADHVTRAAPHLRFSQAWSTVGRSTRATPRPT